MPPDPRPTETRRFNDLIRDELDGPASLHPDANPVVTGLCDDSRRAAAGDLFIARDAKYAAQAVAAGAHAVVVDHEHQAALKQQLTDQGLHAAVAGVPAVDQRLAGRIAERFYGSPAHRLKLVGITGTNGKTTTALIAQHLIQTLSARPCGTIGTVHIDTRSPDGPQPAELTTPGAIDTSRILAQMLANGCGACVMETSSHALQQGRVDHLPFAVGVFTNLTQDHLDYHESMAAYARAKQRLFQSLAPSATAVLNLDDPAILTMAQGCRATPIHTTLKADHAGNPQACVALDLQLYADRSTATFVGPWGSVDVTVPMAGRHNVSNALQAAAAAYALQPFPARALAEALLTTPPVPGRMEPVPNARFPLPASTSTAKPPATPRNRPPLPGAVLVDYAHTPDAVMRALTALRPVTPGRLIVVLGCGGDRDKTKRPLMAQTALKHADHCIFTSDNPRTEPPEGILADMLTATTSHEGLLPSDAIGEDAPPQILQRQIEAMADEYRGRVTVEPDRRVAIQQAIASARANDTVLLAGKGHEDYQIVGPNKTHFDDREEAVKALGNWVTEDRP